MTTRAYAENAQIFYDDGSLVKFHPHCPHCGKVIIQTTSSQNCSHGIANVGRFSCFFCSETFPVVIYRGV